MCGGIFIYISLVDIYILYIYNCSMNTKELISFYINKDVHRMLKDEAKRRQVSKASLIRQFINQGLGGVNRNSAEDILRALGAWIEGNE